jgi:hypothetical protein
MATELTGLPAQGPATLGGVRAFLRYREDDHTDDTELAAVVAATNALVRTWPCSAPAQTPEGEEPPRGWPANVERGADMMAGRLFRRRESPAGVAAFGDLGAVYVMRNDPDVAMLLGLGSWSSGAVG